MSEKHFIHWMFSFTKSRSVDVLYDTVPLHKLQVAVLQHSRMFCLCELITKFTCHTQVALRPTASELPLNSSVILNDYKNRSSNQTVEKTFVFIEQKCLVRHKQGSIPPGVWNDWGKQASLSPEVSSALRPLRSRTAKDNQASQETANFICSTWWI